MFISRADAKTILDALDCLDDHGQAGQRHYELAADLDRAFDLYDDYETLIRKAIGVTRFSRIQKGY